jgi:peptide/nickel transport system substrate-binding protein
MLAALASTSLVTVATAVLAQAAGDPVRPLVLLTRPQAANPSAFQAAELMAQAWGELGLKVDVRPMPNQQHSRLVWYDREKWDMTMWQMVGRPERSDPDELVFNLFHSTTAPTGFNFVGYRNPEYDKLVEAQRGEIDAEKRRALLLQAQEMINRDQPYALLVHPVSLHAYNRQVHAEASAVMQAGLGLKNFWTWISLAPTGARRDIVTNSTDPYKAISPLYIGGAPDSVVMELLWDRLLRIGADGRPQPWAAESVNQTGPTTIEITIRAGMKWHDGSPLTIDDVIFSFEAPATGDEVPMFKPFVANIAKLEKTGERSLRMSLKRPEAAFFVSTLSKINLIPKKVWDPVLRDLLGKPENAESHQEEKPLGSGPYRFVRAKQNEEIVLEANPDHFAAPKAARWIMRIMPNVEATLGALRLGEITVLSDYQGDPDLLKNISNQNSAIKVTEAIDIGIQFLGYNMRRAPFSDPAFRRALSAAVDRELMAGGAWSGQAVPSNSVVSPALKFWHAEGIVERVPGSNMAGAKKILAEAGYRVVNGRLHYPTGVKETTPASP